MHLLDDVFSVKFKLCCFCRAQSRMQRRLILGEVNPLAIAHLGKPCDDPCPIGKRHQGLQRL